MSQWFLNPDGLYRRGPDHGIVDEQHRLVAMVTSDEDNPQEADEVLANAHLIAAAPELLSALTLLVNEARSLGWDCSHITPVIYKATGKDI
jgi:hypothetical protein